MSFVCPRCGKKSFNPNDEKNRYCASCRGFVDDLDVADVTYSIHALKQAQDALLEAMMGIDEAGERERALFHIGRAQGRLRRISARIYNEEEAAGAKREGDPKCSTPTSKTPTSN